MPRSELRLLLVPATFDVLLLRATVLWAGAGAGAGAGAWAEG